MPAENLAWKEASMLFFHKDNTVPQNQYSQDPNIQACGNLGPNKSGIQINGGQRLVNKITLGQPAHHLSYK